MSLKACGIKTHPRFNASIVSRLMGFQVYVAKLQLPRQHVQSPLHSPQLIAQRTAVTTMASITPGDDRAIAKNGGKSKATGLDLMHIFQLILHSTTVTTITSITPGDD